MAPRLSICIPTYNRADILDDCLSRLGAIADAPVEVEIVISDNASTDATPQVVARHAALNPAIRAHRMPENRGPFANRVNAAYQATGELVVFLADDDSLILENLYPHVARMEAEPDLAAIFTDWIAWDDAAGQEMHRYFHIDAPLIFAPDDPMGLVNTVIQRMLPPEVGVYRRGALLRSQSGFSLAIPFHGWMYALSRLGRIRFDLLAFYREHRVLKAGLARTHWANMQMQLQYVGDEMRITLESLLLQALQDAGQSQVPADQVMNAKQAIDRMLHARLGLEIDRACHRGEWILAVELRRRQVLWYGPGSGDDLWRDVQRLVLPACVQAIQQTYRSLSEVAGVVLRGFATRQIADAFATRYPDTPLLAEGAAGAALVVYRDEAALAAAPEGARGRHVMVLEQLTRLYRVARERIDVGGL
jgi:hypothetical protein